MQINSINGTNFTGLLVIKHPDQSRQQVLNTDHIVEVQDCASPSYPIVAVTLSTGSIIKIATPISDVIQAYQKAASTFSEELEAKIVN